MFGKDKQGKTAAEPKETGTGAIGVGKAAAKPTGPKAPKKDSDPRHRLVITSGVLAAVSVAAIGFSAVQYTSAQEALNKYEADMVSVAVPNADIEAGTTIDSSMLKVVEVPASYSPADALTDPAAADGLHAYGDLTAGVPVASSMLEGSDAPGDITRAVTAGKLAKAYDFASSAGLSPLLAAGDYVTVFYSSEVDGVVLTEKIEGVRVLSVGDQLSGQATDGYSFLTLELTADQVESLAAATTITVAAEPHSEHASEEQKAQDEANEGRTAEVTEKGGKDASK